MSDFVYRQNFWRRDIDFLDFDMFDFLYFEEVVLPTDMNSLINSALEPFSVSIMFKNALSDGIYNYCYGKMISLKNDIRWKNNFLGDIKLFLLEQSRYFQAFSRDVNTNIINGGSFHELTESEKITGGSNTKQDGSILNSQNSSINGVSEQQGTNNLGNTLTVLNNQTTSTHFLASANEESYSTGSVVESASSSFQDSNNSSINLTIENSSSLSDTKDRVEHNSDTTLSPLEIAQKESSFQFQKWYPELLLLIDKYFLIGGYQYD